MAMKECPRCKFLQPEDRFCANCGIDMVAYNSGPSPVYSKGLLSYPGSAAVVIAAVIVGVVVFFKMQPDNQPEFGGTTLTKDEEFSKQREQQIAQHTRRLSKAKTS
jgi:hypothetical protein